MKLENLKAVRSTSWANILPHRSNCQLVNPFIGLRSRYAKNRNNARPNYAEFTFLVLISWEGSSGYWGIEIKSRDGTAQMFHFRQQYGLTTDVVMFLRNSSNDSQHKMADVSAISFCNLDEMKHKYLGFVLSAINYRNRNHMYFCLSPTIWI